MTNRNPAPETSGDFKTDLLKHVPRARAFAHILCCYRHREADEIALIAFKQAKALRSQLIESGVNIEIWMLQTILAEWRSCVLERRHVTSDNAFLDAFSLLPDGQIEALAAVRGLDLDYKASAILLGVARGTVKSRVNRANQALMDTLGDALIPEPLAA